MDWESYTQIYYSHILSTDRMRLLALLAKETLEDFPSKLPEDIRVTLLTDMHEFTDLLGKLVRGEITDFRMQEVRPISPIILKVFTLLYIMGLEVDFGYFDFTLLIRSNELVMAFAFIDAFLADSLRAICQTCPRVLCSNKEVDTATIISCGGWKELIEHLTEQYVFEFGWSSVVKRLEALKDKHGVVIQCSESDLELLKEAEEIRNVIVHNGGRASRKYIANTQQTSLQVGEPVPITSEYLDRVFSIMKHVVYEVYVAISRKFFSVEDSELRKIVHPSATVSKMIHGSST